MVGDAEVFKAILDKYNAHLVYSIDELAATLQIFSHYTYVANKGIASIHDSGGRKLIVDLAEDLSIQFAKLSRETKLKLSKILEPTMDTSNPLELGVPVIKQMNYLRRLLRRYYRTGMFH